MSPHPSTTTPSRRGFTLVELMVVLVIISILSSLALAGLAGARQRAKIEKTKSTIRKIHEILMPQYQSYSRLRVTGASAIEKLDARRRRVVQDLPDQWNDITSAGTSAAARAYYAIKTATRGDRANYFQGAECLALIVLRGGFSSDAPEHFRQDEIGDADGDQAVEFLDAFGMPIRFIRWPAGFSSIVQIPNADENPDPLDPMRVSGVGVNDPDFGLVPLIYSAGPDGAAYVGILEDSDQPYDVTGSGEAVQDGWLAIPPPMRTTRATVPAGRALAGTRGPGSASSDNITNHDLITR